MKNLFFVVAFILTLPMLATAQQKETLIVKDTAGNIVSSPKVRKGAWRDSAGNRTFSPRKAAIYSAVCPGLGQIYNKKYWKLPIVYAAIGIPIYTFFDNRTWYNRTRYALSVAESQSPTAGYPDSVAKVHSALRALVDGRKTSSIINYRNDFRKNMDYSILFTLLFWGLNVVDATVDAHLKGFNVNDNLSMQVRPAILGPQAVGVSIVVNFTDNNRVKTIP